MAVWAVLRGVTTAVGGTTAAAGVRQACGGMEGVGVEAGGRRMAGGTELEAEVAEEVRTSCPWETVHTTPNGGPFGRAAMRPAAEQYSCRNLTSSARHALLSGTPSL